MDCRSFTFLKSAAANNHRNCIAIIESDLPVMFHAALLDRYDVSVLVLCLKKLKRYFSQLPPSTPIEVTQNYCEMNELICCNTQNQITMVIIKCRHQPMCVSYAALI
jgi:hypothetical protein